MDFPASHVSFRGGILLLGTFQNHLVDEASYFLVETWGPIGIPMEQLVHFVFRGPKVPAGRENNGAVVHGNKMYLFLGSLRGNSWMYPDPKVPLRSDVPLEVSK